MAAVLAYTAAAVIGFWGIAHVVPTRRVVAGFGNISADNRRVLLQEWLAEALAMWTLPGLVVAATITGSTTTNAHWVYRVTAAALAASATLTGLTGARTAVVWFKICPAVLTGSAALLLAASLV